MATYSSVDNPDCIKHLDDFVRHSPATLSSGLPLYDSRNPNPMEVIKLNLERCHLKNYANFLHEMKNLEDLNLAQNYDLNSLLPSLIELKNLKRLDLMDCKIKEIPKEICQLSTLLELNLAWNEHIHIPSSIAQLTSLTKLILKGCNMMEYPEVLSQLANLQELNLCNNPNLKFLKDSLKQLEDLRKLDLYNCGLTEYPEAISELGALEELNLGRNVYLKELPETISHLTNLKCLQLMESGLLDQYEAIFRLEKLESLNLWKNNIPDLTSSIKNLKELKRLNIASCKLYKYPEVISELKSLEELILSGNRKIRSLPGSIQNLKCLKSLSAIACDFERFPDIVSELDALEQLILACNWNIKEIPDSLKNLTKLTKLNMSQCTLSKCPNIFTELSAMQELNISKNKNITALPESMSHLKSLQKLNISGCGFKQFPNIICEIRSLQDLNLSQNQNIKILPPLMNQLENLLNLDVSDCGLTWYPPVISELKALQHCCLAKNKKVISLPDSLRNLTNLKSLNVSGCGLSNVPKVISRLTWIQELNLSQNLTASSTSLKHLTGLKKLDISKCKLKQYPEVVSTFTTLQYLNVACNEDIKSLSDSIVRLEQIREFNASECGLTAFPAKISELTTLHKLSLSGNKIVSLPVSLAQLTNLLELDLSNCGLTQYPEVVSKIPSIKWLKLSKNNINRLPPKLKELHMLSSLDVSRCGLDTYPESISEITSLEELILSQNMNIKYLPVSVGELKGLRKLHISECGFTRFPEMVLQLLALEDLNISGNKLETIPKLISNLRCLEHFDISKCIITEFPEWVFDSKKHVHIKHQDVKFSVLSEQFVQKQKRLHWLLPSYKLGIDAFSQLSQPPCAIFKQGNEACITYYKELNMQTASTHSMCSVAVLGKTGAGKTSLVQTIEANSSVLTKSTRSTVVVSNVVLKRTNVLLNITDFGGHDVYEMAFPFFLKSLGQIIIIAVKLTDYTEGTHEDLVTRYLANTLPYVKGGCIYITGTQSDRCSDPDNIERKMELMKAKIDHWMRQEAEFASKGREDNYDIKNVHFFVTSSRTMKGIEEIERSLLQEARERKALLPERWKPLFGYIFEQKMKNTPYLTTTDCTKKFGEDCTNHSLQVCLRFLHNSGIILYYENIDEKFNNLIFHNYYFIETILKKIFKHDLVETLSYDHKEYKDFLQHEKLFKDELKDFRDTGTLSLDLLKCILYGFKFGNEFEKIVHLLEMFELCYRENNILRFPWFLQREEMGEAFRKEWPKCVPPGTLQYDLRYVLCHRIPATIYERFCVRLQNVLGKGTYTRKDCKNNTYLKYDGVQVFFSRNQTQPKPFMQLQLRSGINSVHKLSRLCLKLAHNLDKLCSEYNGIYIDAYFLCPHCIMKGENPSRRAISDITTVPQVDTVPDMVPCDCHTVGSDDIPTALIHLPLLEWEDHGHRQRVEEFCKRLSQQCHPTVSDDLLIKLSQNITEPNRLRRLGVKLGISGATIQSCLTNYPKDINEAGYQVLHSWKEQRVEKWREEVSMKEELKHALCSDDVGLRGVYGELKKYF